METENKSQETTHMDTTILIGEKKQEAPKGIPTAFLRGLGVVVIIVASAIYLLQGAEALNPYHRHFIFMGITALFGGLTWILGGVLKEMKGARTFVALAVAAVPVLFAQLGGMVSAMVNGVSETLPKSLVFSSLNAGSLALIIGATALITVPVVLLGNRILARTQMKPLTILLLAANALILIPFRGTFSIGLVLTIAVAVILFYLVKWFKKDSGVRSREGSIAASMLFLPLIIMAIRTVTFYVHGTVFAGVLAMLTGVVAVVLSRSSKESAVLATVQTLGALSVVTGWILALSDVVLNAEVLRYYLTTGPAVFLLYALSFLMKEQVGRGVRTLAVLALGGIIFFGQLVFFDVVTVVISLIAGTAMIAAAAKVKEKMTLYTGSAAVVIGIFGLLKLLTMALSGSAWILLMLGGIVIIVGGSLTELFNREWKGQAVKLKEEVSAWN